MAMRSQIYQYLATADSTSQASIFVGGLGNNITKPAETTATQFVVIEQVASTPSTPITLQSTGMGAYTQIRINTTDYFLNPDNRPNDGVPGTASPYPRSVQFQPSFNLYPRCLCATWAGLGCSNHRHRTSRNRRKTRGFREIHTLRWARCSNR